MMFRALISSLADGDELFAHNLSVATFDKTNLKNVVSPDPKMSAKIMKLNRHNQ